VVAASGAAGPAVAAGVLSLANWPWLFAANIPLGLLVLAMGWHALPRNADKLAGWAGFPVADALLNSVMFVLVFFGAQLLGQGLQGRGASIPIALALFGAGVLVGAFHLRRQWARKDPLVPMDLLRQPVFSLSLCTSVASFSSQTLSYVALPFLLLDAWGRTAAETGLLMSGWPLAIMAVAPVVAPMIGRRPSGLLGGIGLATLSAGLALLAVVPADASFANIAWRMALCGAGFGLFQSPNNHTILTTAPRHRSGAAGGMLGTARLTGQMVGAVLVALVFGIVPPSQGGAVMALWAAALLAAIGSVISTLRVRHPVASRPEATEASSTGENR
jgi:DHA2 family multidrug resistance protein-like MFS transporter